jgi:hypothetical protein
MSNQVPWDFAAAEASIVGQLKAQCQSGEDAWARQVGTRATLAEVAEEMQVTPAIYLVYDGYVVLDADEQRAMLAHRWLVIVAIANAAQGRESAPRDTDGGPYQAAVFKALHGFMAAGSTKALTPATPPRPYYSEAKFAYYPVAFTSVVHHSTRWGAGVVRRATEDVQFPYP